MGVRRVRARSRAGKRAGERAVRARVRAGRAGVFRAAGLRGLAVLGVSRRGLPKPPGVWGVPLTPSSYGEMHRGFRVLSQSRARLCLEKWVSSRRERERERPALRENNLSRRRSRGGDASRLASYLPGREGEKAERRENNLSRRRSRAGDASRLTSYLPRRRLKSVSLN